METLPPLLLNFFHFSYRAWQTSDSIANSRGTPEPPGRIVHRAGNFLYLCGRGRRRRATPVEPYGYIVYTLIKAVESSEFYSGIHWVGEDGMRSSRILSPSDQGLRTSRSNLGWRLACELELQGYASKYSTCITIAIE